MNTSVSPLPLPLWPTLALSLSLFCLTATAVTISAYYTNKLCSYSEQSSLETPAPVLATSPRAGSRPVF